MQLPHGSINSRAHTCIHIHEGARVLSQIVAFFHVPVKSGSSHMADVQGKQGTAIPTPVSAVANLMSYCVTHKRHDGISY